VRAQGRSLAHVYHSSAEEEEVKNASNTLASKRIQQSPLVFLSHNPEKGGDVYATARDARLVFFTSPAYF
jgi:hypothetical protein